MSRKHTEKSRNRWTVIAALAAVAALIIPIALFLLERQSKTLTVDTVSTSNVADLSDPALSVLKLTYKDQTISRVTAATIQVANTGTVPIEMHDFERPLTIRFDNDSMILAASPSEQEPDNLRPEITVNSSTVTISPLLLNPRDQFRLNIILRGEFKEPTVDARISGISSVSRTLFRERRTRATGIILLLAGTFIIFSYGYFALLARAIRRGPATLYGRDPLAITIALGVAAATLLTSGAKVLDISQRTSIWLAVLGFIAYTIGAIAGIWRRRRMERPPQKRETHSTAS